MYVDFFLLLFIIQNPIIYGYKAQSFRFNEEMKVKLFLFLLGIVLILAGGAVIPAALAQNDACSDVMDLVKNGKQRSMATPSSSSW